MAALIDTSLWIDFLRPRSPQRLKQFIAPFLRHPAAHLAEPIIYEILRHATPAEAQLIYREIQILPILDTPRNLWTEAARLGQACRQKHFTMGAVDLLVATVAIHHGAEVITFDEDFQRIAGVSSLCVRLLKPPPTSLKGP